MSVTSENDKIIPLGGKKKRYGRAKKGTDQDDLVTIGQLTNYLNGELVTDAGNFNTLNTNQAIKISVPGGFVYLPILAYP